MKEESFAWQIESIRSIVRQNCKKFWQSSSHLAINEAMIAYRGQTLHKVKLLNKPIKEGYKVWILGDSGYVYDWLWHSHIDGPEDIPEKELEVNRVQKEELTELIQIYCVYICSDYLSCTAFTSNPLNIHFLLLFGQSVPKS